MSLLLQVDSGVDEGGRIKPGKKSIKRRIDDLSGAVINFFTSFFSL
jgi:hypothetical protein